MTDDRTNAIAIARASMERWFQAGLEAVDPYQATIAALKDVEGGIEVDGQVIPLASDATVVGLAIGKAAAPMARALEDVLGDRVDRRLLLTKDGHLAGAPDGWQVFEAAHPVPDSRGVAATNEILKAVAGLAPADLVIVLVSGGGSALLESPRPPLTLEDIQHVTDLLLRAGAPIQDLNAVRSELSQVKGGGLRRTIGDATCISLILSDVLGNSPTVIASGPTILRDPRPDRAMELIEAYGIAGRINPDILGLLRGTSDSGDQSLASKCDRYLIVGDNQILVQRIADAARSDGYHVEIVLEEAEGEASELASRFVELAASQPEDVDVIVGGGEATVTVRGDGVGGRNTEFALAAAEILAAGALDWVVASLASDGQDGANDAAGAIADRLTTTRGDEQGLSAQEFLRNNDSGSYFAALNELVVTGPTGTNVNDAYIAVRTSSRKQN